MTIQTLNPATGKSVKSFAQHTDAQIELAIEKSVIAYQALRLMSFAERSTCMTAAAVILEAHWLLCRGIFRFGRLSVLLRRR